MLRLFSIIFPLFPKATEFLASSSNGSIEEVKRSLRAEISLLSMKFLVGLVLAATSVVAILEIAGICRILFGDEQSALYFQLAGFSLLAILCIITLYFLVSAKRQRNSDLPAEMNEERAPGVLGLASTFVDGLVQGIKK